MMGSGSFVLEIINREKGMCMGNPLTKIVATLLNRSGLMAVVVVSLLLPWGVASADKPEIDPSYVDGKIYYMIGPHIINDAIHSQPQMYAKSEELYLLAYPINPTGDATDPKTVGDNYHPLCDPCYHPGLPGIFAYHDHVLTGAPGLGKNGTAGEFKGPWKIIVLMYNRDKIGPGFQPITSVDDIDDGIANGMFEPVFPNGPIELETGNVLICPLVSPHA
jgi:hypothetical protein